MGRRHEAGNGKGCDAYQDGQYPGFVPSFLLSPAISFNVNATKGAVHIIWLLEPAFWADHLARPSGNRTILRPAGTSIETFEKRLRRGPVP